MFDKVLIANRGEIALRVMRTCARLGIATVAVYSDADADAAHVRAADQAVRLGPAAASESYLSIDRVIAAARETGAQAIHPGYGFLSENAAFAAACEEAGIVFLGPTADAIRTMGDKITAKQAVAKRGVPLVPGIAEPGLTDERLIAASADIGFPILIKPSAGGGGKGMHAVFEAAELPEALAAARREAASSFGDDTLFLERLVATPRHIEVQVLADEHGNVVHLGERECSLQRRHQKVIEEAPSALLDEATRARIGEAAVQTAKSVGYRGAGTVEFIVSADQPDEFFFMEMNTRLQVEHPVTEEVTGVDLVEWMLRIGAGAELGLAQDDIALTGHAVEARIYAEDPARGFLPTGGTALDVEFPAGEGIRVDAGLEAGQRVASDYDPMIAKLIAFGPDRATALARLEWALGRSAVPGITTNIDFLRTLIGRDDVRAGDLDTGLIDRMDPADLAHEPGEADIQFAAGAVVATLGRAGADASEDGPLLVEFAGDDASAWGAWDGWRSARPERARTVPLSWGGERREVVHAFPRLAGNGLDWTLRLAGVDERARLWADSATRTLWVASERGVYSFSRPQADSTLDPSAAGAEITAPMPGSVIELRAADGDEVAAGDPVVVVEAMKMEHVLRAPVDGIVHVLAAAGAQVALDEVLATVVAADAAAPAAEHAAGETGVADAAGTAG
ncbi:acetyl-CoA carboxylase biotin carboxylase subunit [Brevibacterium sp. BRM-1]|uniref:acetyl/propionyl/methylcrotonyl-CoA carboxylase subunit alpha n=1 Tax=Brevibacterium sp. BRM-1 TaxID=2999062 RepID=UPI00227EEDC4|nr:acetyl-CoA carboxylase biotin carboxylase subunit [Brevibacterium sp. BRM-1]WAL39148.1 acetyl-CoA carboxylase biotin carboxylase subunit [Brevibacterium sp. BRM-1]